VNNSREGIYAWRSWNPKRQKSIQAAGIVLTFSYAAFIIWIYATGTANL